MMRGASVLLALCTACGDAAGGSASTADSAPTSVDPPATGQPTTTAAASSSDTGATDGVDASGGTTDEPGVKLDVPGATTGPDAPPDGCPSVDLLFVIDNSGSMADNQESLVASFPGFISSVQAQLGGAKSYHIGVVTTDNYPDNPPACWEIGKLVTRTGGPSSSGQVCTPFASGANYMDETEPDLAGKFACAGLVGTGGSSDERPIRSLLDALKGSNNAPGACNAGFSRQGSLLVVVIITDEDDVEDGCTPDMGCMSYGSGGTPEEWYDQLVAYRGGLPDNIVVLSLLGRKLDNPCAATPASHLMKFTNMFNNGHLGDVCAGDYAPFFAEALPIIDAACSNWTNPG